MVDWPAVKGGMSEHPHCGTLQQQETLQRCLCGAEALSYLRKQMSCLRKMAPGFIREGSEVFRPLAQEA